MVKQSVTRFHFTGLLFVFLALSAPLLQGCFGSKNQAPEIAYLVAYSILDDRFQTSTRLDLTADIFNPGSNPMESTQLIFTDQGGTDYILDYQTVGSYAQEGRYNAFPLPSPIKNLEVLGQRGEEFHAPSGLHFLFGTSFKKVVLKYRNKDGIHEIEIPNIEAIMTKSRQETIAWMRQEHEEKVKIMAELEQMAKEKIAAKNKVN